MPREIHIAQLFFCNELGNDFGEDEGFDERWGRWLVLLFVRLLFEYRWLFFDPHELSITFRRIETVERWFEWGVEDDVGDNTIKGLSCFVGAAI